MDLNPMDLNRYLCNNNTQIIVREISIGILSAYVQRDSEITFLGIGRNEKESLYNLSENLDKFRGNKTKKIEAWKRAFVLRRDNGRCTECGSENNLTIDHVIRRVDGGLNTLTNLVLLCKYCHMEKTKKENKREKTKVSKV